VRLSCLYVNGILLTSPHTNDDAHGLVPTRLIVILVTLLHIYLLKLIIEHGLSFNVFNVLMV
jgi:hypothetical protein